MEEKPFQRDFRRFLKEIIEGADRMSYGRIMIGWLLYARKPVIPAPPSPPRKRQHRMWVKPWIQQRDGKGAYTNVLSELYRTDTQDSTKYTRMKPEFFQLI